VYQKHKDNARAKAERRRQVAARQQAVIDQATDGTPTYLRVTRPSGRLESPWSA
jgi:hypothetical protein